MWSYLTIHVEKSVFEKAYLGDIMSKDGKNV